jgi:hypothetical protein
LAGRARGGPASEALMGEWLGIVIVMVVWLVLQSFVLPRLGVPT